MIKAHARFCLSTLLAFLSVPAVGQVQSVIVGDPPMGTMPFWLSGTACSAYGQAIAGTENGIVHAHLSINDEVVRDVDYPPPGARNVWLSVAFDSSHFADGTTLVVKMEAWDNLGGYMMD